MSKGGKLYELIKETAEPSGLFDNLRKLLPAVRSAGIQVFIVPHRTLWQCRAIGRCGSVRSRGAMVYTASGRGFW